jgi:hypothetical protein
MPAGINPSVTQAAVATASDMVQMQSSTLASFEKFYFIWQMATVSEILIVAFLIFTFRAYLPFVISRMWTHLPVVGVMTRVRNIVPLGGFTLRNGMYRREFKENVMYYSKKYLGSYFFMGAPFDIVHIDRGFVQDAIYNKFIVTLQELGYGTVGAIENALTFNGIDPDGDDTDKLVQGMGFDSYGIAKSILNPSDLSTTTLLYAPKMSSIPMDALLGYGADIAPGSIAAQVDDTFEFRKPPAEENKLLEWMPYILLMVTMAICAAVLASIIK